VADDQVSATVLIDASAEAIFAVLDDPAAPRAAARRSSPDGCAGGDFIRCIVLNTATRHSRYLRPASRRRPQHRERLVTRPTPDGNDAAATSSRQFPGPVSGRQGVVPSRRLRWDRGPYPEVSPPHRPRPGGCLSGAGPIRTRVRSSPEGRTSCQRMFGLPPRFAAPYPSNPPPSGQHTQLCIRQSVGRGEYGRTERRG
jgi:hypothetical protein